MQDFYVEQIVKRNRGRSEGHRKILFALTVFLAVVTLLMDWRFVFPLVIVGVYSWYLNSKLSNEYEYIYVNGDLDIEVVKAFRRKRLGHFTMEELECMALQDSPRMEGYKGRIKKRINAVTGSTGATVYAMIFRQEKGIIQVLVEPEEELMNVLRLAAPHKIL